METPEAAGLDRAVGFPASYGVDMARMLSLWQQQMREVSAAFVELAETGILEWSADQRYAHDPVSVVTGSDGEIYFSQAPSGGDDPSEDPTTDTEQARWRQLELTVPDVYHVSARDHRTGDERRIRRPAPTTERSVNPAQVKAAIDAAPRPLWL